MNPTEREAWLRPSKPTVPIETKKSEADQAEGRGFRDGGFGGRKKKRVCSFSGKRKSSAIQPIKNKPRSWGDRGLVHHGEMAFYC
jgi:hypothetical protein